MLNAPMSARAPWKKIAACLLISLPLLTACASPDVGAVVVAPKAEPVPPPAAVTSYKPPTTSYQTWWGNLLKRATSSLRTPTEKPTLPEPAPPGQ